MACEYIDDIIIVTKHDFVYQIEGFRTFLQKIVEAGLRVNQKNNSLHA